VSLLNMIMVNVIMVNVIRLYVIMWSWLMWSWKIVSNFWWNVRVPYGECVCVTGSNEKFLFYKYYILTAIKYCNLKNLFFFGYRELMRIFPNAKVVLTVRDDPQSWYKSVVATIHSFSKLSNRFEAR
jgi:hypothetical protein